LIATACSEAPEGHVRWTLRPQVCYDEWRWALISETRTSIPAEPGRRKRIDYEYWRSGVAYLHMLFELLVSKRHIRVTAEHTMHDFAHCMLWLLDEVYPLAKIIRVVLDNLATHKPAALFDIFPSEEARRILGKLELQHLYSTLVGNCELPVNLNYFRVSLIFLGFPLLEQSPFIWNSAIRALAHQN